MRSIVLMFWVVAATSLHAQSSTTVTGRWTTIDDNTGKPRSVVEITEHGGTLSGRIVDLYDKSKLGKMCEKCPGERHNTPLIGLEIIRDMKADPSTGSGQVQWEDGTILDPETGKIYDCKLWLEGDMLKVRGYVAFFYRTQTWVRGR